MTTFHPGGGGSSLTSAGNSIPCHAELVSASHNKEIPKQVRDDKLVSKAHSKELNVLTSYRLNDFKKKAGATHVDMSDNIRRA